MGYVGKIRERNLAIRLRRLGISVREIQRRLGVSKSSISLWTREVQLTELQKRRLYLNIRTGRLRGSIIAAENKQRRRADQEKQLYLEGKKEFGKTRRRDCFVAGVALYFAEGDKRGASLAFSNSDPRAIQFMMTWFRDFLLIPEEKFRGYLYIHDNQNSNRARNFWSQLTKIPLEQFNRTYVVQNNKNRFRKVLNSYGVFRISISDVRSLRKVRGWIAGLLGDTIG